MEEQPTLTKEQIEQAKNYRSIEHPVLDFLAKYEPQMKQFNDLYAQYKGGTKGANMFTESFFAGFADEFESLPEFTLSPLEIIAIWSKLDEIFPKSIYTKYRMSTMLACTYGKRGLIDSWWDNLTERVLLGNGLPDELAGDRRGLSHFVDNLKEIDTSLKELNFYSYGTRESMGELAGRAFREDDEEAKAKWEKLTAWYEEHKDDLLGQIHENWGNGMYWMFLDIGMKMKKGQ